MKNNIIMLTRENSVKTTITNVHDLAKLYLGHHRQPRHKIIKLTHQNKKENIIGVPTSASVITRQKLKLHDERTPTSKPFHHESMEESFSGTSTGGQASTA
jgi:hypothetical protein